MSGTEKYNETPDASIEQILNDPAVKAELDAATKQFEDQMNKVA